MGCLEVNALSSRFRALDLRSCQLNGTENIDESHQRGNNNHFYSQICRKSKNIMTVAFM